MSVYIVTGKLGNGKTLVTVGRIKEALRSGHRVATNLDINLLNMFHRNAKNIELIRLPDKPNISDLDAIGRGYDGPYDESKFGTLVLDECGTWFNSRNWQDKTRKDVNDWFLHARKLRWHVYLIIQDVALLDSQARDAIAELVVYCRRLDNIRVPFIGPFVKTLTGYRLALPRIHRARVCYVGVDIISDIWNYRGNELFSCYSTDQLFLADYPHATHCVLPPWYTHGRYAVPMTWSNKVRITKIYWKRFKSPVALATGLLLGAFFAFLRFAPVTATASDVASSSASSSSATSVSSSLSSLSPPPLIDRLKNMRITGMYTVNGDMRYQFSSYESPEGDSYITDDDLTQSGITLAKRSPCRVDAFYGEAQVTIICL